MTKRTRPTPEQIEAEIATLVEIQPKVRQHSFFGGDNREAIGVQIEVLRERLSDSKVYDRFGEDAFLDADEFDEQILSNALDAAQWLAGESDEAPSVGWKELVQ